MSKFPPDYIEKVFSKQVAANHRTLYVLIGLNTKKHIISLHNRLCTVNNLQSIIWCYKNAETALDSLNKKLKVDDDTDDQMTKWIKINSPDYISYKECNRVLGRTCDMLILQDFEALSPNMIAMCMETVKGGGVIVLLLDQDKSINSILSKRSDLLTEIGVEKQFVPRYNKRLFKLLANTPFTVFLDGNMKVMEITSAINSENIVDNVIVNTRNDKSKKNISDCCKTEDQRIVLEKCMEIIGSPSFQKVSIVAPRGRGKSALLGFAIAHALDQKFMLILVTALYLENIQTLFEYVALGLNCLGYKKSVDFKIIYTFQGKKKLISKIEIIKGPKQVVEFVNPFDPIKSHPNLLVVDEAASIPLVNLKELLSIGLVLMASTASGYEGTGRVFRTKLQDYIKDKNYDHKYFELNDPIRYSKDDPIEAWLNKSLILDTSVQRISNCPPPTNCQLYQVNKDLLFSGNKETEDFLSKIFSLFIASHYRNSPNDLQILADSPNHEVFVLLSPGSVSAVLCAIQVVFEGRCDKQSLNKEGNAIPWIIQENYNCNAILNDLGARIVRIAVHPNLQSMGYGSASVQLLRSIILERGESKDTVVNHSAKNVLLYTKDSISLPKISWLGTCFGISEKLLNFWKKLDFCVIGIKQTPSKTTGEFSAVLIQSLREDFTEQLIEFQRKFYKRFLRLLSFSFKAFPPSLCLSIIYSKNTIVHNKTFSLSFDQDDIQNLNLFVQGVNDFRNIIHLVPSIAIAYFESNQISDLSVLQQSILVMIGLQHRMVNEVSDALNLEVFHINSLLVKIVEWGLSNCNSH